MDLDYSVTTHDRQTSIIASQRTVDQVIELLNEAIEQELDPCMFRVYLCSEGKPLMWMRGDRFKTEIDKFDEILLQ